MTREEILNGLKSGKTLVIDRSDAPELKIVMKLQDEGYVTTELRQIDDQSSQLRVRYIK
jgi:hypothetical protein